jgi:2-methyl-3-hydroxypyridine 5-carboxylic acid dioxygenase
MGTEMPHVEIAGAGFAGLTAAIALKKIGWSVRVHESEKDLRAFGAGIFIWENGLRVLRAIGAYEDVMNGLHSVGLLESRFDGQPGVIQRFGDETGCRMMTMTRQHLYSAILNAARLLGIEILTSSEAVGATLDGVLRTASGKSYPADLVIGADGVKSQVRESLGIKVEREIYGDGITRLLVNRTEEEASSKDWNHVIDFWTRTPGPRRILYTPCNDTELYVAFMAPRADAEAAEVPINKKAWLASFPYLAPIIDRVQMTGRHDLYQTTRLETWSHGRVALVGDAAHAMPPTLGQGAGLAMSNALGLAVALGASRSIEEALRVWEKTDRPITDHTQNFASDLAKTRKLIDGHAWSDDALRAARHVPTGTTA